MNKSRCFGSFTEIDAKLLTFDFFQRAYYFASRESGGHFCPPQCVYSNCSFSSLSFLRTMKQVTNVVMANAICKNHLFFSLFLKRKNEDISITRLDYVLFNFKFWQ